MTSGIIHIINGPNLNKLGQREPDIYGHTTLADIEALCTAHAATHNFTTHFTQSNEEGALITALQEAGDSAAGLILNGGAYTHTSVALYDALKMVTIPSVEVHLSNIFAREPFRHHSYISPAVLGVICGFGAMGYTMAIDALRQAIKEE
ncbi:MAG: type II 3-dehydroquinate dehydratase [Alphaproteobacteria bacterium]|nr:type II 3-dehydroquinate dehydratase [Alphaproteobacteria bacterium]